MSENKNDRKLIVLISQIYLTNALRLKARRCCFRASVVIVIIFDSLLNVDARVGCGFEMSRLVLQAVLAGRSCGGSIWNHPWVSRNVKTEFARFGLRTIGSMLRSSQTVYGFREFVFFLPDQGL